MDNLNTAIGLFQFAVESIGYIQLARDFKDQFETYQLKLDIIQLRLSRWGEIANVATIDRVESIQKGRPQPSEEQERIATAISILNSISDRLLRAQRKAQRIHKQTGDTTVLSPDACVPRDIKKVRTRITDFIRRRRIQVFKAIEGVKWVFYKKEHFTEFVKDMSDLLDQLEQTLSDSDREKLGQLSQEECKGISKSNLEELSEIVEECDPWLKTSVEEALDDSSVGTIIRQSHNTGSTVGIHNGDNKGVSYGTNSYQSINFN